MIQGICAEVLRVWLAKNWNIATCQTDEEWKKEVESLDKELHVFKKKHGFTGAQWGAGVSLAYNYYKTTPKVILEDKRTRNVIQVKKGDLLE